MSDLISTQDSVSTIVDTAIRKILSGEQKLTKEYEQSVIEAVDVILDTVRRTEQPIIRCKDCKHYIQNLSCVVGHYNGCEEWEHDGCEYPVKEDDFCSYAERRTDERSD